MVTGWGIYGIGTHAHRYFGPALNKARDTRIVAVCSRSMERAKDFAGKYDVAYSYDSLEEMLKNPEVDVVYIATPAP